jgi:hypothetical protein
MRFPPIPLSADFPPVGGRCPKDRKGNLKILLTNFTHQSTVYCILLTLLLPIFLY